MLVSTDFKRNFEIVYLVIFKLILLAILFKQYVIITFEITK